ncbi:GntR family transcriptional regulator [Streptococcus dysgalactiae]|uniref:GntR family transcriptional regulator n=1 Tax=Streptococcus dysgalactiae TaxID=1334 RepID=A0AAE9UMC6_STRDY|nr:GntR family transcriptional regulator [Streptococcus dysgalactiae]WAI93318.1 GntR family transcriptional regulator [Streptococcus dysgalactiae]
MLKVDYSSPLYLQVRELILSKIKSGEYPPGSAIPSENEFADKLGINRLTIRAALDDLVEKNIIRTIHGKGSFVVGKKIPRDLERLEGFNQTMNGVNVKPSIKILKMNKRMAGEFYGNLFEISPEEDIYYIERICYANNITLSLEEIFIPAYLLPKLEGIDLNVFSLTEIYGLYNVKLDKAYQTLEIVHLSKREAKLLNVEDGNSIMMVGCTTFSNNKIIEFSRNYTLAEKCQYTVNFSREKNYKMEE